MRKAAIKNGRSIHYRKDKSPVPLRVIQQWARMLAAKFQPQCIILFGSYARGQPHRESDVDILVVMPSANEINQSIRLTLAVPHPFPLDLVVRTPERFERGMEENDGFLCEIAAQGIVLYE